MTLSTDAEILFSELNGAEGNVGLITLNRPKALNALTHHMIVDMYQQLIRWAKDSHIKAVIVKSAEGKAFCAGGDIRAIYDRRGQDTKQLNQFFFDEYRLNHLVARYPKPYIALLDGITMGGGAGISLHAKHRVASENLLLAMPETAIGLFPDVGATHFFQSCPGKLSTYLALSGSRLNIHDAHYAGLVDFFISSNHFDAVIERIVKSPFPANPAHAVDEILEELAIKPDTAALAEHQIIIDGIFSGNQVEDILNFLNHDDSEWSQTVAAHLKQKSPMSLAVTLQALRRMKGQDIEACLQQDFILVQSFLLNHDLYEGIRSVIIDKDMKPHWQPASLAQISDDIVAKYFDATNKQTLSFEEL